MKVQGSLEGAIAVVAGASRGAGRGIALALGEAGVTVYVTARSTRAEPPSDGMPGTIEETAEAVSARGGNGIAVRCDHTTLEEVEALFERVRQEQGRLDVLANAVWGGNESYDGRTFAGVEWTAGFWEHGIARWEETMGAGVWASYLTSRFAVPLMLPGRRGLIAFVTEPGGEGYHGNLYWDLSHATINRMAFGMAQELKRHRIASVALSPGFMRTERVMAHLEADPELQERYGAPTESTEYLGRAVAALASDPDVLRRTGKLLAIGELAREYGFTDVDGTQPTWPPS